MRVVEDVALCRGRILAGEKIVVADRERTVNLRQTGRRKGIHVVEGVAGEKGVSVTQRMVNPDIEGVGELSTVWTEGEVIRESR